MKKAVYILLAFAALFSACKSKKNTTTQAASETFDYKVERFADIQILKYEVPGLDKLSTQQKELVYYLTEAALYGRDIIYSQNCEQNLFIRSLLEEIYKNYNGDRTTADWKKFDTYIKRIWASNGIHHHYSEKKILPEFSREYFQSLFQNSPDAAWPDKMDGITDQVYLMRAMNIIFNPNTLAKGVVKDKGVDKVLASANNYYEKTVTEAEVINFYKYIGKDAGEDAPSFGLNSRVKRGNGTLKKCIKLVANTANPLKKWFSGSKKP